MLNLQKKIFSLGIGLITLCSCSDSVTSEWKNELRAPSYPLITIDPYTSAWSPADHMYDTSVKHWTGKSFPLIGVAKVDGISYRFMGKEEQEFYSAAGTSEQEYWVGSYTVKQPEEGWEQPNFKVPAYWKKAEGAFGTTENEPTAKTQWSEEFIWVRRTVDLKEDLTQKGVYLEYSHDDDVIIYINGIKVVDTGNACKKRVRIPLTHEVTSTLKKGKNLIAAYCRNRGGNALLDFGLLVEKNDLDFFVQTARQTSVNVQATQTYYTFVCGPVNLDITFTAPLLMNNLDLMTRPVNYITYAVQTNDNKEHEVELYFEAGPQWALSYSLQSSRAKTGTQNGLLYACTGSLEQPVLAKKGDDLCIDWGYFYMAVPEDKGVAAIGESASMRKQFLQDSMLNVEPTNLQDHLAMLLPLGKQKKTKGYLMLAYDDIYSIQYFGQNLRPYWNRNNNETVFTQLQKAQNEYNSLIKKCTSFDNKLMEDANRVGGRHYAELCALAYRQVMAAHKLVESPEGYLLYLSKENFSNGCINTVDLTYPSAPMYLVYNPELVKGMMNGIFYYSESGRWTKPFAAHDLGAYPLANGQVYGGDMPVEESGNMLILSAAIAAVEGNAGYAEKHWKTLTAWTDYLVEKGLDPENQLCTDDFAGHFAHNANLSIKAIMGVASYGYLAQMRGLNEEAEKYFSKAKEMSAKWEIMANDGDHYRLTFDKHGTWSQKYNMVWDLLLQTNIFPATIAENEIAYYLTKQNKYGLPLDSRELYTKSDWVMWTATLSSDRATFEKFVAPIYRFMNVTPDRVPMSDWSWTHEPRQRGFQARSVIGGYFIKMLEEKMKNLNY